MNEIVEFERRISKALEEIGANYPLSEIIADTLEFKNEIIKDNIEHGDSTDFDFWNFISDDVAVIFTIFESQEMSFYIFREKISKVTPALDNLSMAEVGGLKTALREKFSVNSPTAKLPRGVAEYWLSM